MQTDITMPQLGESVTEGTVGRWLKQPGDQVEQYEPLLEVVTDKVDSEIPAPVAGTLLEIMVPEGETVRVGVLLARLGDTASAAQPDTKESVIARAVASSEPHEVLEPVESTLSAQAITGDKPQPATGQQGFLSPVVARLVAEHSVDIRQIRGSGEGGRISKRDVLRHLEHQQAAQPQLSSPTTDTKNPQVAHEQNLHPQTPGDTTQLMPLSPMRRAIAEHMERSVRTAPQVTTVMEVNMSQVVAHRLANQDSFQKQGVRLTFTAYIIQATVEGLRQVPLLNSRFQPDGILLYQQIHLGMAVALEEGLIVPVLRNAQDLSLLGIARQSQDLAERARAGQLKAEEVQGGTFTISNHGTSGSLLATPIINQPQAGILGVGVITKRVVVLSQKGGDSMAIRPMCYLSLTFDHRVADGQEADRLLAAIKGYLEHYSQPAD